ncbi:DpnII family type II restriction endonuclease [Mycoplasma parvum]|uniref:Restriction endonuclease type II DpnII-like domain-containing protein n=1 Tax=Mycoplasma parvum str. Indiana TaxID=1403316 RepID=U5NFC1_9MOLU|nr:DpnII family type II restriction endonuclease [Mycoplasma parvum]AGX88834.1 hypothetical protein PRV_00245 [Mycoplasma parvum str. Indiana]
MKRNFDKWFSSFKANISNYQYYVDFEKVLKNVNDIKIELNILNSLLGTNNFENDFQKIVKKYPETLKCIPILLATRRHEIYISEAEETYLFSFETMNYSVEKYTNFMKQTGLSNIFQKCLINNLLDYVLGVEVGLDFHSRKNRAGLLMEKLEKMQQYLWKKLLII